MLDAGVSSVGTSYVLAGVRTPRGKGSPKGALHAITPQALVTGLLDVLGPKLAGAQIDDVILGCAAQTGDQAGNLARAATLAAGWDAAIPGVMINRFCASGIDAINLAAARVRAGDATLIIAGGVESVSRTPPLEIAPGTIHMGVAADLVATLEGIEREACDEYAAVTRAKAVRARAEGHRRSIVPVRAGDRVVLDHDENVAYQPSADELAALPPLFGEYGHDPIALARYPQLATIRHLHTRGSSPSLADASALVAIGDRATAERLGLAPRARILATATCAGDPVAMLTAGQTALERALAKAGLRAADLDVVEFAEAFAALCVRIMRDLDLGHDRLNPNGGTIALGHAYGATGAVLMVDALDELERRGAHYAAIAVSGAAGLGSAAIIERA